MLLCVPASNVETEIWAIPPPTVAVPSDVVPSKNCTVPLRVTPPGYWGVRVAVKVTGLPNTEGFGEELIAVPVEALFTVRPAVLLLPECTVFAG